MRGLEKNYMLRGQRDRYVYGRNQSILFVFLAINTVFALLKIDMCFKRVEASQIMPFNR